MVVEAGVDLEVGVGGLEVAGEGFEVGELLLELRAEEEAADLHPGVGHQARVGRPRVQVRVVVTWQRELINRHTSIRRSFGEGTIIAHRP